MRMAKKIAVGVTLLGIASLIVYLTTQYWLPGYRTDTPPKMSAATQPEIKTAGQGQVWICPMHPEIMQDHPGACPICGMDLVHPKGLVGHDHGIHVDTASIQKLGVRLVAIKRMSLGQEIRTYGNVAAGSTSAVCTACVRTLLRVPKSDPHHVYPPFTHPSITP